MKTLNFNCRGHRWNEILPDENKNMQEAGYIIIKRPVSYSQLKKYGQMATAIDIMPDELPKSVRKIGLSIASQYN